MNRLRLCPDKPVSLTANRVNFNPGRIVMSKDFTHGARTAIKRFHSDDSGATAIEYGLIAAAVGLVLVATMPAFQSATNATYGRIVQYFQDI